MIGACRERYLAQSRRIWHRLPDSLRAVSVGRAYGRHLHALVCRHAERTQSFGTFFLRNRAELLLMGHLLDRVNRGATLNICVLACSKGAEVYSILWAIHTARPDLRVITHAIDISPEILAFAERGVYALHAGQDYADEPNHSDPWGRDHVQASTAKDQDGWMFERVTDEELHAIFELDGDLASVRSWLREGVIWRHGDASDPALVDVVGPQDFVVANRFLCHMEPPAAGRCLRNAARLVRPGGHLFVSGIDLEVRAEVAERLAWKPVLDLIKEIHEGDSSLRHGWPLEYWGLEPFADDRPDWRVRYASVFQIGETADS